MYPTYKPCYVVVVGVGGGEISHLSSSNTEYIYYDGVVSRPVIAKRTGLFY